MALQNPPPNVQSNTAINSGSFFEPFINNTLSLGGVVVDGYNWFEERTQGVKNKKNSSNSMQENITQAINEAQPNQQNQNQITRNRIAAGINPNKKPDVLDDLKLPLNHQDTMMSFRLDFYKYRRPNPLVTATPERLFNITLPLPREIIDHITPNLSSDKETQVFGGLVNELDYQSNFNPTFNINDDAIELALNATLRSTPSLIRRFTAGAISSGIGTAMGIDGETALQTAFQFLGAIPNPHPTVFFEGVRLRTFTFSFRYSPTSASESAILTKIIKRLKASALPSTTGDTSTNILTYPLMVKPQFIFNGGENDKLYKFKWCLIEDITTAYGSGISAFYKDGQPHIIDFSIRLKEIEFLTAKDFDEEVEKLNVSENLDFIKDYISLTTPN